MLQRTIALLTDEQVLQGQNPPQEVKGSWWSKHWKKVVGIAASIIGGPIGIAVGAALNSGAFERGLDAGYADSDGNVTLSDEEASYLESWFSNVFMPKYEGFIKRGNIIFSTTDINKQVELINLLNTELAVTKEYLKWDNPKLTKLAEETRNAICTELIYEVEKIIFKTIEESSYNFLAENVEVKSTASLLSPIVSFGLTFTAIATRYKVQIKDNSPVDTNEIDLDADTTSDTANNAIETANNLVKETTSKNVPLWIWVIGGLGLYKILK